MERWYAVHTKPYSENRVATLLDERGIRTFHPMIKITIANQRKRRTPLFPGYLFAQLDYDIGDPSGWKWTPGLRYVVTYGDWPIPIPNDVVQLIQEKVSTPDSLAHLLGQDLEAGDRVRIKNGPFKDMLAVFVGPVPPAERVNVLLDTLNRSVRLSIDLDNLKKESRPKTWPKEKRRRRSRGRGRPIG